MHKAPTLALLLAAAFLAGCSDAPASGELTDTNFGHNFHAEATIAITRASDPLDEQAPGDADVPCEPRPDEAPPCVPASTRITLEMMSGMPDPVPAPDATGYVLWGMFNGSSNDHLGALTMNGTSYEFKHTVAADWTDKYDSLEVRMGSVPFQTAPFGAGKQTFTPHPALDNISISGSYKGKTLTLSVSGLPNGTTYTGYFYNEGAAGGAPVRDQNNTLQITNGMDKTYTSKKDIGSYVEFHVHVTTSSINLYKATL